MIDEKKPFKEQNKYGWVPVSERLPEKDMTVMASTRFKDNAWPADGTYIDIVDFDSLDNTFYIDDRLYVVAWMPLPEPYREDGESDGETD